MKIKLRLTGFLVLFLISSCVAGEKNVDSISIGEHKYVISIEQLVVSDLTLNDTIGIDIVTEQTFLAGFDLKIAFDGRYFTVNEVLPGEIYDSCGWDFFNARQVENKINENPYLVIWQIVSLADMTPDSEKPLCFGLDRKTSLIKLVASSQYLAEVPDTVIPVYFLWEDCTDNTISGITGNNLAVSDQVIEYHKNIGIAEGDPFPTLKGTPQNCLKAGRVNMPQRVIEFHNGAVEFKYEIKESLDTVK